LGKLLPAILFMAAFSAVACVYILYYLGLKSHEFEGTIAVHSLLGIVLGLFLVLRTNSAYDRWWEGRRLWGSMVNSTRNFAMKLNAYLESDEMTKKWFSDMIPNFVFATKEHLRNGVLMNEIYDLDNGFREELRKYNHKPNKINAMMYQKVN